MDIKKGVKAILVAELILLSVLGIVFLDSPAHALQFLYGTFFAINLGIGVFVFLMHLLMNLHGHHSLSKKSPGGLRTLGLCKIIFFTLLTVFTLFMVAAITHHQKHWREEQRERNQMGHHGQEPFDEPEPGRREPHDHRWHDDDINGKRPED